MNHTSEAAPANPAACNELREFRCACNNLLGRLTDRGIEVKCRRCKRLHVIPASVLDSLHCAS